MRITDLMGMWTTEFAVHHLDLVAEIDDGSGPTQEALDVAAVTLDGILNAHRPVWWDLSTHVLKATGRAALLPEERSRLGPAAASYPGFG